MNARLYRGTAVCLLLGVGTAVGAAAANNDNHSPLGELLQSPTGSAQLSLFLALLVAVGVGAFALQMRRVAHQALACAHAASVRAAAQEERAGEAQDLLDTSTMLAAAEDLETALNISLIRLADLVPYSACALFLYDPETDRLQLAHRTGVSEQNAAAVRALPVRDVEWIRYGDAETHLWPRVAKGAAELGALAGLDPEARSVIIAPLRPLPLLEFLGLIYVGRRDAEPLTEHHRQRVEQFVRYASFHIQQKCIQDRFKTQARTDAMTGLDNYRAFRQRLEDEARRALRYNRPLSLILLDIDHFKRINDTYLHVAGDAILRQMAMALREILRGSDVAARYGGEEMAIICPETAANDARTLAERIRTTVEKRRFTLPVGSEAREIGVTVSLGVATLPAHTTSDAVLVELADKALYAAKTAGRNQVCTAGDLTPTAA